MTIAMHRPLPARSATAHGHRRLRRSRTTSASCPIGAVGFRHDHHVGGSAARPRRNQKTLGAIALIGALAALPSTFMMAQPSGPGFLRHGARR